MRLPTPLDPMEIKKNPAIVHQRYYVEDNYRLLRGARLFHLRDTPLRSLYRIHDVLCADVGNYVMLENDYFWGHNDWKIKDIPDPQDPNPIRYTVLAALTESMAEAYNSKIEVLLRRGDRRRKTMDELTALREEDDKPYEEPPPWAANVPAVEEWVSFYPDSLYYLSPDPFENRCISADPSQLGNI